VISIDPDDPVRHRRIRGQSSIASTPGRVSAIEVHPTDAPACAEALAAISSADAVLLGPGSWFTSVIPHLLVTDLAQALIATRARVVVVLNLEPQVGETDGFSAAEHLHALTEVCPMLHVDAVIADPDALDDEWELRRAVEALSARLVIRAVAEAGSTARHDPIRLAAAIAEATGLPGSAPDHNQQAIGQMRQGNEGAP
jgi:uncharacterized cofD-like protein